MTLILNNAQVAELVSMQDCVDVLEDAFLELAEGRGAFRRRQAASCLLRPTALANRPGRSSWPARTGLKRDTDIRRPRASLKLKRDDPR